MAGSFGGFSSLAGAPQGLQMAYMRDPRLRLAQQLQLQGADASPVQHWTQGAARLAQALAGNFVQDRADGEYKKQAEAAADAKSRGLSAMMGGNAEEGYRILGGNPYTADMGLQAQMADRSRQQQQAFEGQRFDRDLAARREDAAAQREFQAREAEQNRLLRQSEGQSTRALQESLARLGANTTMQAAQLRAERPQQASTDQRDYEFARTQGFPGTFVDFMEKKASLTRGGGNIAPPGLSREEQAQVGQQLGVPVQPVNPLAALPPKAAEAVSREQAKQTERGLAEMRDATNEGRAAMADLNRFKQLQEQQSTGGIYSAPIIGGVARSVAGMFNPNVREMQSLSDKIAPTMRAPGSGATSDFDARMFQSATVGVDKDPTTNRNIIAGRQAAQQVAQDRLAFMESYATANGGSLRGADQYWQQYLDANPIFDPTKPNAPTINPNRRPFQEFFRSGGQAAQPAPASNIDALLQKYGQ
jgi:hypothetical protein